jgi:predicted dehydrogenase
MKKPHTTFSRRRFLKSSLALGSFTLLPSYIALGNRSTTDLAPSEKLNLAVVGIGNQGERVLQSLFSTKLCNVVALCDIDLQGEHTQKAQSDHPAAKTFTDFRVMFDKMADQIDAVLIATPDHSHFAATMLAMSLGKHVIVEKPLAHTYGQCERLMSLAQRSGVVTQMGNQGHSSGNYFQFKEWREAGIIKNVTAITAYMLMHRRWHGWGQDVKTYSQDPMPDGINWEQWQDVVATEVPFANRLHPQGWRSWFEFGCGAFGDWGPHILDTCHRFLELGLPEKITPISLQGRSPLIFPQASTIRFNFPARGPDLPACEITWCDGQNNLPQIEERYRESLIDPETKQMVDFSKPGKLLFSDEFIFRGGSHATTLQIEPREKWLELRTTLPRFTQRSSHHYANFLLACKGEEQARSPFSVSGPLTQMFNLGMIVQRLGETIHFDRNNGTITNNQLAQALLDPAPRKNWESFYKL